MRESRVFLGRWRVVDTEIWGSEDLDLLGEAFFSFASDGLGSFQFLALQADVDYRVLERGGQPIVEFSWEGDDDGQPCSGRGCARIEAGELHGKVFIHRGDESAFVAER